MQISASSEQDHSPGIFVDSQTSRGGRHKIEGGHLGRQFRVSVCCVTQTQDRFRSKKQSHMVVAEKVCKALCHPSSVS
jgi:hypothetical protein